MANSAAQTYAAMIDAVEAQRVRLRLGESGPERWSSSAARFTADPHRQPDRNLQMILTYLRPEHSVIDVGGGAGRYALPIALRCRKVVNVEPSKGMGQAFEASAKQAGIENATWVASDWEHAEGIEADVSLVVNVTYFVRDIVPFIDKLVRASRRRVLIATSITPPPNQGATLFELVHGEPQALVPGYRELLPVLWEVGIVPDVTVLDEARSSALGGISASREEAIDAALATAPEERRAELAAQVAQRFDELFEAVHGGFRRRPLGDPRMILITWVTSGN